MNKHPIKPMKIEETRFKLIIALLMADIVIWGIALSKIFWWTL